MIFKSASIKEESACAAGKRKSPRRPRTKPCAGRTRQSRPRCDSAMARIKKKSEFDFRIIIINVTGIEDSDQRSLIERNEGRITISIFEGKEGKKERKKGVEHQHMKTNPEVTSSVLDTH